MGLGTSREAIAAQFESDAKTLSTQAGTINLEILKSLL